MRMTITEIERHCEAEYKSLRRAYSGRDAKKLLLNLPFEIESIRQELMKKHDYVKDHPSPPVMKVKRVWGKHLL